VTTVLSVVGARPQFVKAAPLSRILRGTFREILVHTGQHYDQGMSEVFFRELGIPEPDVNLGVGSAGHGEQTARMREGLRELLASTEPDLVLVYGDTNSTLAGALAAAERGVPLAHVEAGLRADNLRMPEEVNRIAADHLSDICLCPTRTAMDRLENEGIGTRAKLVGDVMLDACLAMRERSGGGALARLGVTAGGYHLATIHRAENTDVPARLAGILGGLSRLARPVIFPVHPRTRREISRWNLAIPPNVSAIPPVSYVDAVGLVARARKVITDSGGLQKEAYFLGVPCVTVREETEWPETVQAGWNVLVTTDPASIVSAVEDAPAAPAPPDLERFGGGRACERILGELRAFFS
jgi:UDP-N-acetylglucosamine 2-epimerase